MAGEPLAFKASFSIQLSTMETQLRLLTIDPEVRTKGKAQVILQTARSLLARPQGALKDYDFTLNPYKGCTFGCSYCYASFFQADPDKFSNWGKWVEPKINALSLLKCAPSLKGKKVLLSSATDPYQPIEADLLLTRRILEILALPPNQPKLVVQTRSPLVTRDIDILTRFEHLQVNISITTDDENIRKKFEPGCPSIAQRLKAVKKLKQAGIRTTVCIAPMLPISNPRTFAEKIKNTGCDYVVTGFFRINDRPFAGNTREEALQLAKELGWTRHQYERTRDHLKRYLRNLDITGQAWGPL